jgi:murein L,D-transpeptidase YcbB/YkuD
MTERNRQIAAALAAFTLLVLVMGIGYVRRVGILGDRVTRQIRADLKARDLPDDAPWRDRRTLVLLRGFYKQRGMRPAWTTGAGPNAEARQLADVLARADDEGLDPEDYSTVPLRQRLETQKNTALEKMSPKALAEFDLLCSIAALHYMSDVHDGRISPRALDAIWVAKPHKNDMDARLADALKKHRVKAMLEDLPPDRPEYRSLREARARWAKLADEGGWPSIGPGPPLRKGAKGVRVRALRQRLAAIGDLKPGDDDRFDGAVEAAVKRAQERFGRVPDGVVGEPERLELNVSAEWRLRQIELNMERWRWLPATFGERYLLVNIPEYMLHLVEGGRDVLDMRVVVGKAMNQTPVFSDTMTQVVVNPTWSVPQSIVSNEIVPALAEDPDYLAKHRMRLVGEGGEEIDPSSVDLADSTRRVIVRQDAGEDNALGSLKFVLPNSFDIYLHDTPAGALFALEERSFSHGCIRVAEPLVLAHAVLRGRAEADTSRLRRLIDDGETKTINLPKPLPVHIVYFTAIAGEDVSFREDVYGIDQDLVDRLRGRARVQAAARTRAEKLAGQSKHH